ncbi:MAG TPA: type II toxin-antitoxin system VapC family toxin [Terriglobales bacterium]|nr:type II toxin-antitoxin system VapC family toxin [Terriglobales bacterium]
MILDTSAVAAIAFGEPEASVFAAALEVSAHSRIAAPTYLEAAVVILRAQGPESLRDLDLLLHRAGVLISDFTATHARIALTAYRIFGNGSGHPARLNLGDCFSYALAKATGEPLLYKGRDFALTDIASVL